MSAGAVEERAGSARPFIAARLRSETTLPIKGIAARVQIGTAKGAKSVLHPSGSEPWPTQSRKRPRTLRTDRIQLYGFSRGLGKRWRLASPRLPPLPGGRAGPLLGFLVAKRVKSGASKSINSGN
jgi:hypothetical protein